MKAKSFVILFLFVILAATLAAEAPLQKVSGSSAGMVLRLQSPTLKIENSSFRAGEYQRLSLEGASSSADTGAPDLPLYSGTVILPPTGSYSITVRDLAQRVYPNIKPYPVQSKDDNSESDFSVEAYRSFHSAPKVLDAGVAVLRDFRVLQLAISPVAWDAATGELTHCTEMEIEINFTATPGENEVAPYQSYSPAFRNLYEANLLNFDEYRDLNQALDGGRLLIIHWENSNPVFQTKLKDFISWKRQKGHEVNAVSALVAGSSSNSIKNYIQNQYNNPDTRPDHIILIGDVGQIPTFYETLSGYGGEGDYPYTYLSGSDTLGDVMIGRISVSTVEQMAVMMKKIYMYERDIYIDPMAASWVNRMLLIGDPSTSGISCVYNMKYVKELAQTVNPDYSFIEDYDGGYTTTINSGINQGVNFFGYRGYIGMSGWNPGSSLANNPRFPHAVILTCGTGNFDGTATTETFVRLGTEANPAGAVTAIGMATSGTHTMFNNNLSSAIFKGIFANKMRSMGEALLYGRLFLNEVYAATHPNQASYFAHWCNLMGDPSMEVFVGIPEVITLTAPASLPYGSLIVDAQTTDSSGNPIAGVCVTAYAASTDAVVAKAYSDEYGNVSLQIPSGISEALLITASKNDHKPAQSTVLVAAGGLVANGISLFDNGLHGSTGDGDGIARAGESVAVILNVRNTSDHTLSSLTGTVSSDDPHVNMESTAVSFADLAPYATEDANVAVVVHIDHTIPSYHDVRLEVTVDDAEGNTHVFPVHIPAYNALLSTVDMAISAGGNSILDPTETGSLTVTLKNEAYVPAYDLQAQLISLNDLVVVNQANATIGTIAPNNLAPIADPFELFARSILIPGMQIPFKLRIYTTEGFEQFIPFNITIGNVTQNTPLGPDAYGYFIYDETDTAFMDCPQYEWIEINPTVGGSGTRLTALNDSGVSGDEGDQNNSTALQVVPLPFTFPFYGEPYNEITVSTNGFIAMGQTGNGEFRNSRLPAGLGPSPMIAAFWDDLIQISDAGVYQYYDTAEHIFIIEYYKMRNGYNRTSLETFQVIFYDPMYHPTSMGDGKIKIQYKDFNNVDVGGGGYTPVHGNYSTIGIKDHTNTRGLEYTYNNTYPLAAAPLGNSKALLISTVPVLHQTPYLMIGDVFVNEPNANGILEPGETAEVGIRLINQGLDQANAVSVHVSMINPHAQLLNPDSNYANIPGDQGAVNYIPILISISPDCPDGAVISLSVNVNCAEGEWTYPISLQVKKPDLHIAMYYINDTAGNANGLADPGESFELVVNYTNPGILDAKYITSSVFCVSEYVTIANPEVLLPSVVAGSQTQAAYEITISEDAPVGSHLTFFITYLGEQITAHNEQLLISLGTTGMFEDFETTNGSFTPVPSMNAWQWGVSNWAGAHSGNRVWGTRLNESYSNNANYLLTTPAVYVGSSFMLEFWHRFDTEATYDGGCVQASADGGQTWTLLQPDGGYTDNTVSALASAGFSGQSSGWISARFPLTGFANQNVIFRFRFATDTNTTGQGWFIDDVRTTGYLQYAGKLHGSILSGNPEINFTEVLVCSEDGICAYPDASGAFELFLPMGSHAVSAGSEGYYSLDPVNISLSNGEPELEHDYYLGHLLPVSNLQHNVWDGVVTMNWSAPEEPEYDVVGYEVYRRMGGGLFETVLSGPNTSYQETVPGLGQYQYYVKCLYAEGASRASETITVHWNGVSNQENPVPQITTALNANYPNPFNPSTTIAFSLAESARVKLNVYNLKGQKVKSLLSSDMASGTHSITWNGDDDNGRGVSSGIYLIRMDTPRQSFTRKAMLMK